MNSWLVCVGAVVVLAIGCGSDDEDAAKPEQAEAPRTALDTLETTTETAADPAQPAARGPLVKLRDSQFGPVLFSGADRALYLFTRDSGRRSRCYGDCAVAWPPFYAKARPRAGRGVDSSLLGTTRRRNGRRQVTYKGQPLYFYVSDPKGEVLCNDIVEFGGTWFALDAAGNPPT
jgi:predicted lipoprotein with Yx(FWY)xxD motif